MPPMPTASVPTPMLQRGRTWGSMKTHENTWQPVRECFWILLSLRSAHAAWTGMQLAISTHARREPEVASVQGTVSGLRPDISPP